MLLERFFAIAKLTAISVAIVVAILCLGYSNAYGFSGPMQLTKPGEQSQLSQGSVGTIANTQFDISGDVGSDFDGTDVALGRGIAKDIDGIVVAPVPRQKLIECIHGFLRKLRQLTATANQSIRCQHPQPPCIRNDREVGTLGPGLFRKHLSHVKQLGNIVDAEHADAAENRIQDAIGFRQ